MDNTKIKGAHIICHLDEQKLVTEVETFGKNKADFKVHYSTTVLPTGPNSFAGMASALCTWETTEKEFREFRNRLMLSAGKIIS